MRFPKVIQHRHPRATIYGKSRNDQRYRVAFYSAGRRRMAHFGTYSEALDEAERTVRDLDHGSQAPALTRDQARDALAALEQLEDLHRDTGRRVSLLASITAYCDATRQLNGQPLTEAVSGYLETVASVRRTDVAQAAEELLAARQPKTEAKDGRRPQLSTGYAYNVAITRAG